MIGGSGATGPPPRPTSATSQTAHALRRVHGPCEATADSAKTRDGVRGPCHATCLMCQPLPVVFVALLTGPAARHVTSTRPSRAAERPGSTTPQQPAGQPKARRVLTPGTMGARGAGVPRHGAHPPPSRRPLSTRHRARLLSARHTPCSPLPRPEGPRVTRIAAAAWPARRRRRDPCHQPAAARGLTPVSDTPRLPCGVTVWLTGLPSAGKSTIAHGVEPVLRALGQRVEVLDGDAVRPHLAAARGYSREDRAINIRRIGWVAELLARNGVVVLVSAIAPFRDVRDQVRAARWRTNQPVETSSACASITCRRGPIGATPPRSQRVVSGVHLCTCGTTPGDHRPNRRGRNSARARAPTSTPCCTSTAGDAPITEGRTAPRQ